MALIPFVRGLVRLKLGVNGADGNGGLSGGAAAVDER